MKIIGTGSAEWQFAHTDGVGVLGLRAGTNSWAYAYLNAHNAYRFIHDGMLVRVL